MAKENKRNEQTDFFLKKKTIACTIVAIVLFSLCVAVVTGSRIVKNAAGAKHVEQQEGSGSGESFGTEIAIDAEIADNTDAGDASDLGKDREDGEEESGQQGAGQDTENEESLQTEVQKEEEENKETEVNVDDKEAEEKEENKETEKMEDSEAGIIGDAAAYLDPGTEPITGMKFMPVSDTVTPFESVNLRTLPTREFESEIVYVLANGENVERTGINEETGWSRVLFQGRVCYAVSDYLTTDLDYQAQTSAGEDSVEIKTQFMAVDEMVTPKIEVNLRRLPSVTDPRAEVAATIFAGEIIRRTGINTDLGWSRVEYHGVTLYCVSSYVELVTE